MVVPELLSVNSSLILVIGGTTLLDNLYTIQSTYLSSGSALTKTGALLPEVRVRAENLLPDERGSNLEPPASSVTADDNLYSRRMAMSLSCSSWDWMWWQTYVDGIAV